MITRLYGLACYSIQVAEESKHEWGRHMLTRCCQNMSAFFLSFTEGGSLPWSESQSPGPSSDRFDNCLKKKKKTGFINKASVKWWFRDLETQKHLPWLVLRGCYTLHIFGRWTRKVIPHGGSLHTGYLWGQTLSCSSLEEMSSWHYLIYLQVLWEKLLRLVSSKNTCCTNLVTQVWPLGRYVNMEGDR